MKKALLTIFVLFFLLSIYAQPQLEDKELQISSDKFMACSDLYAFQTDDQGYIMLQTPFANVRRGLLIPKTRTEFHIHQFDQDLQTVSTTQCEVSKDYMFLGVFDNADEIISLYIKYVKKSKTYVLCKANTGKVASNPTLNINELIMCKLPMLNSDGVYFSSSEDKTKHSVTFISTDKKSLFQGIHTIVLDNYGDIIWEAVHKPSFENETFTIGGIETNNQGEVNIGTHSYFKNKRGNVIADVNITVFNISQDGIESSSTKFQYGSIRDMKIKTLANGNVFLAGYYTDDVKKLATRLFSVVFDLKTASFTDVFTKDLLPVLNSGEEASNRSKQRRFALKCRDIEQLSNGHVLLFGEEERVEIIRNQKMNTTAYVYYLNDICIHVFSEDGEELNSNTIQKAQVAQQPLYTKDMQGMSLSFHCINLGEQVLLLYNDDKENFDASSKKIKTYGSTLGRNLKNASTVLLTVDGDGNYEKSMLNEYTESRRAMTRIPYIGEHDALLVFIGAKAANLIKFSF